jgi:hypothetical protein
LDKFTRYAVQIGEEYLVEIRSVTGFLTTHVDWTMDPWAATLFKDRATAQERAIRLVNLGHVQVVEFELARKWHDVGRA